jgi:hypothetical protein
MNQVSRIESILRCSASDVHLLLRLLRFPGHRGVHGEIFSSQNALGSFDHGGENKWLLGLHHIMVIHFELRPLVGPFFGDQEL